MTDLSSRQTANKSAWAFAGSALLITLFLFFIDEGYYDFQWMARPGNWVPFVIYAFFIWTGQWLMYAIVLSKYNGKGKWILSMVAGTVLGFLFVSRLLFAA